MLADEIVTAAGLIVFSATVALLTVIETTTFAIKNTLHCFIK
jgi:hypothetical protein